MNSFEFNKIAAAVIIALLLLKVGGLVADGLIAPKALEKHAFAIEGVEVKADAAGGAAPAGPEPIEPLLASADPKAGEVVFKKCATCHTADKGGANKVGPNLYGVVNRKLGSHAGFAYSSAMAGHGGDWTYDALNHFLYKPRDYVKGTKMSFAGLSSAKDRADVIAYLRMQADSPAPLPN